jgi:endonuclease/exonuclease/phosphatase (EEP) superfamily protein YafD
MMRRVVLLCVCGSLLAAAEPQAPGPAQSLRIASLNLAKRTDPQALAEIRACADLRAADILLLQEVVAGPHTSFASAAAGSLGLRVTFAPAFRLGGNRSEGLAILSRYPLAAPEAIPLGHNDLHFKTRSRIALAATVESPLGAIRVINVHLDNRINSQPKREQLAGIWGRDGRYGGPMIVGGDFNTGDFLWLSHVVPLPFLQHQRAVVEEEMQRHGFSTPFGSGPATFHLFRLKLDWIYTRGLRATQAGVTPIRFSDHNAVWTILSPVTT